MSKTLRLLMPQWQGGNNPPYYFGAKLLSWLAPINSKSIEIEVPVEPYLGTDLPIQNGIVGRNALLGQLHAATKIIEEHEPERIITFGGDCLVSQAPFSYLNQRYGGKLGVLWLDAHPDISTPEMYKNGHAMVLGNLLGKGDNEFSAQVKVPLKSDLVIFAGLQEMTVKETKVVDSLNIRKLKPEDIFESSKPILSWISEKNIEHLAIHLDLDVLDPKIFRSLLFANPDGVSIDSSRGTMTFNQITRTIQDVSDKTNIVGLTLAEFLPWDDINLHNFLNTLPIFKN